MTPAPEPQRPALAAVSAWIAGRLGQDPETRHLVATGSHGPVVRWKLVADDLDRRLARDAWQGMTRAGLIAPSWATEPHRTYRLVRVCETCNGATFVSGAAPQPWRCVPCSKCRGRGAWEIVAARSFPATLRGCATFASDQAGVSNAAELAREVARRLLPWRTTQEKSEGATVPEAVVWRTAEPDHPVVLFRDGGRRYLCPLFWEVVTRAALDAGLVTRDVAYQSYFYSTSDSARGWPAVAEAHTPVALAWAELARSGAVVPINGRSAPLKDNFDAFGRTFAELPNPFEPLAALWDSGYYLESVRPDALHLVAPLVP